MNITVTQAPPQQIAVVQKSGVTVSLTSAKQQVSVGNFLPKQQVFLADTQPNVDFGIWIQDLHDGTFQAWVMIP